MYYICQQLSTYISCCDKQHAKFAKRQVIKALCKGAHLHTKGLHLVWLQSAALAGGRRRLSIAQRRPRTPPKDPQLVVMTTELSTIRCAEIRTVCVVFRISTWQEHLRD